MEPNWNTTVYHKYEGPIQQKVCVIRENTMKSELRECSLQINLINHEYAHSSSNIFQIKDGFLKTELESVDEINKIEIEPLESSDYLQNFTNKFITDADNNEKRNNKATDMIDESAERKYLAELDSILEHGIVIINDINDLNIVSDVSASGSTACSLGLTQTSETVETKSDNKQFHEIKADLNKKLRMEGNKNMDKIYSCTICASTSDVINPAEPPTTSTKTCKYGDKVVKIGENFDRKVDLYGQDIVTTCKCEVPPLMTCKPKSNV